jgi:uncharacterized membrane protein
VTTLVTTIIIVGVVVLLLGLSIWFFLGLAVFLGAATMLDVHDDFPNNKDFEEYDRKRK